MISYNSYFDENLGELVTERFHPDGTLLTDDNIQYHDNGLVKIVIKEKVNEKQEKTIVKKVYSKKGIFIK